MLASTPKPPAPATPASKKARPCNDKPAETRQAAPPIAWPAAAAPIAAPKPNHPSLAPSPCSPAHVLGSPDAVIDATTITVKHWSRLLDGALFATAPHIDWSTLLRRTFGIDALRCPTCSEKMRILSTVTDQAQVCRLLQHLGVRTAPLPRGRARNPTTGQIDLGFDAA